MPAAQELLKLAGKQAVLVHDPNRQRPEMLPHELLQAETAARMPRSEALGGLLQSIVATSKVRQAQCNPPQCDRSALARHFRHQVVWSTWCPAALL